MVSDFYEGFHHMTQQDTADDMTGTTRAWIMGSAFSAGIYQNSSTPTDVASQQAARATFTVVLPKNVTLNIGDRIKRDATGQVLKVTSSPEDNASPAPASAWMQYKFCTAEAVE